MKLATLSQTPVLQGRAGVTQQTQQPAAETVPQDSVQVSKESRAGRIGKAVFAAAVPAAVGVYAGLSRGPAAGIAGALIAAPVLTLGGVAAGAFVGETLMGKSDGEQLGAVFLGGAAGLVGGGVGSYLLASGGSSVGLAVGLGLLGGLSGLTVAIFHDAK